MKGVVCLLLLCCIASLIAAATLAIEGDSVGAHYALSLKSDVSAITLSGDGRLTHTAVRLPLSGSWTLIGKGDELSNHYTSLPARRVETLTLSHSKLAIHALWDREGMAGLSAESGPLSVALFSFALPAGDSLLCNYREEWRGFSVLSRLQAKAGFASVDWEVGYSVQRALSAATTLSLSVGPVMLTERFGPSIGEREVTLALSMQERGVSISLSLSAALASGVIYSGRQQEGHSTLSSSLRLPLGGVTLEAQSEWEILRDAFGKEVRRHVVSASLSAPGWRLGARWRVKSAPTYTFSDSAGRLSLSGEQIGASFSHTEGPWQFTLQFSAGAVLSLHWRYAITIDRGSGSPRST